MKYKVVCFDFDLTLSVGVTASEHLAHMLGCSDSVAESEAMFRAGIMSTQEFSDITARNFNGYDVADLATHMLTIPLVSDIEQTVSWLKTKGVRVIINTIGFRDVLLLLSSQMSFDDVSGVQLEQHRGRFTGKVNKYFPLEQKISFASEHAAAMNGTLANVIAVGDGLSDIPLFKNVGRSISFNASAEVQAQTHRSAEGLSCADLLPIFKDIFSE